MSFEKTILNKNVNTILFNGITLPSENQILLEIIDKAKYWAITHGVVLRVECGSEFLTVLPFTLLPSPFLRSEYEKAMAIQPILNELLHNVAHDYQFLKDSLKDTIKADEFIRNLFEIYETVQKEGVTQDISLGLFRSDYMMDVNACSRIKQIETNTVSAALATISQNTYHLHRYVLTELGHEEKLRNIPENNASMETSLGLVKAWEMYNNEKSIILFVIRTNSLNMYDNRFHEYEINKLNRNIKVIHRTLTQIADTAKLGPEKQLLIDGFEIAVVYYRTLIIPEHYHSKSDWDTRLLIECSLAIKCPSVQYQLVGSKKIQQVLTQPNILEKYLKSIEAIKSLRETFGGLYSLNLDQYGNQAVKMALENPEKYVLKSERDGGGNNIFGINIRDVLLCTKDNIDRAAWVLMDKISSPRTHGIIIRHDKVENTDLVSELGVFGVIIGNSNKIFYNKQAGYLMRSKSLTANEGGVFRGNGFIDSPYLID